MPQQKSITVNIIDRRIVGQDWLTPPDDFPENMNRLVFASLKGGVGRSTALSVTAAHLAAEGFNVLVVDLDLEAPGLGSMLLDDSESPKYGVLDYLVENGRGGIDDAEIDDFVATSELTDRAAGQGIVDVVPAMGRLCRDNPHNVLAKIGRALIEDPLPAGGTLSVRAQIRQLIDRLEARREYDAVLIDARAGLGELTAGALLGMGGTVLLFGVDQPQTFEGYSYLLSHLSQLPFSRDNDLRYNLKFVQAKAPASEGDREPFRDSLFELANSVFYEEGDPLDGAEPFNFSVDDPLAPHNAWWIGFDGHYLSFDPIKDRAFLSGEVYTGAFGDFIRRIKEEMGLSGNVAPQQ